MKTLVISFLTILFAASMICAQSRGAQVKFEEKSHDFGTIKEAKGPVSHVFEFKNTGEETVSIIKASASCGCTRPEYSEEPIRPGKKGKIKVTYNPAGRPGEFDRKVTVRMRFSSDKEKRYILKVSGVVVPEKDDSK